MCAKQGRKSSTSVASPVTTLTGFPMPERRRLMAVFAHPDDESCGPGGTLARCAAEGIDVTLVSATRGELGGEPTPDKQPDATLGAVREKELVSACKALGIGACLVVGLPDGHVSECVAALRERVTHLLRLFRPHVVITFDPEFDSGGTDHRSVGEAVTSGFRAAPSSLSSTGWRSLSGAPLRLYYWMVRPCCGEPVVPERDTVLAVNVADFLEQRRAALACHETQAACCAQVIKRLTQEDEAVERFRLAAVRGAPPAGGAMHLFNGIEAGG